MPSSLDDQAREAEDDLPDPSRVRRVRALALLAVIVQVLLVVGILWGAGPLYRGRLWWVAVIGGFGAFRGVQVFLRAPHLRRLPPGRRTTDLIAEGGVDLGALPTGLASAAVRLEIQDALDRMRVQNGSPRRRVAGLTAFGLGTVGWSVAGTVALVGHDLAGAAVCAVAAAAFGVGGWMLLRLQRRTRRAEAILEEQLQALEEGEGTP